jgi:predicted ArsR family transcriptional regulator
MSSFADNVAGIGLLADPLRRELYLHVCAQPEGVSRDAAADALGIARHKAKFHLDKLEDEGLLTSEFARLTGRSGPGAGRPSKLYRRAPDEFAVSLPGREYELAGKLMAEAIAASTSTGTPVIEALNRAAAEHGRAWGRAAVASRTARRRALDIAREALAQHGYEPRTDGTKVVLANCPFHSLASTHTQMVCGMNLALIDALTTEVDDDIRCSLEPADGRCCVVLSAE